MKRLSFLFISMLLPVAALSPAHAIDFGDDDDYDDVIGLDIGGRARNALSLGVRTDRRTEPEGNDKARDFNQPYVNFTVMPIDNSPLRISGGMFSRFHTHEKRDSNDDKSVSNIKVDYQWRTENLRFRPGLEYKSDNNGDGILYNQYILTANFNYTINDQWAVQLMPRYDFRDRYRPSRETGNSNMTNYMDSHWRVKGQVGYRPNRSLMFRASVENLNSGLEDHKDDGNSSSTYMRGNVDEWRYAANTSVRIDRNRSFTAGFQFTQKHHKGQGWMEEYVDFRFNYKHTFNRLEIAPYFRYTLWGEEVLASGTVLDHSPYRIGINANYELNDLWNLSAQFFRHAGGFETESEEYFRSTSDYRNVFTLQVNRLF